MLRGDDSSRPEPEAERQTQAEPRRTSEGVPETTASDQVRDAQSIAASLLADLQPLTIHTLNHRLLRADVRLGSSADARVAPSVDQRSASTAESLTRSQALPSTSRDGPATSIPDSAARPQPSADSPVIGPRSNSGLDTAPEPHASQPEPAESSSRAPEAASSVAAASANARSANAPVTVAAGATLSAAAKPSDAPGTRQPVPAPTTAPIAAASERKSGSDAHMPRFGAQKAGPSVPHTAAAERTAAMVASQAARGLAVALSRADGAVTLRLNPESLGFIRIKLEMGKGSVLARIEASTDAARHLLEQSSETLRASLEAKGWESSHVRVELMREVDPAAEMLRKLEQQAESTLERQAAQDATARQEHQADADGGDRKHQQPSPDQPAPKRGDDSGEAEVELPGPHAQPLDMLGLVSRLDTTV